MTEAVKPTADVDQEMSLKICVVFARIAILVKSQAPFIRLVGKIKEPDQLPSALCQHGETRQEQTKACEQKTKQVFSGCCARKQSRKVPGQLELLQDPLAEFNSLEERDF